MIDFNQESCERLGPLLSALVDGELGPAEQLQLDSHLETCAGCRSQLRAFREISQLVHSVAIPDSGIPVGPTGPLVVDRSAGKHSVNGDGPFPARTAMKWLPVAIAASVLLALMVTAIPAAPTVTAGQIAIPLAELELINAEQGNSQDRMLKALEMELRALKLQVGCLGNAPISEKNRVLASLDHLIVKVKQCRQQ